MSCDLDVELELIASSLLPSEDLTDDPGFPRIISIVNNDSQRTLHIEVREDYPSQSAVTIELKGNDIGRDVARYHNSKIAEQQNANWVDGEE
ncbi:hypothetical protein CC85DRAFT_289121 [Cutaneotrichosporon oleaginosum]|uniref:RWD domain-containing protein n=1 Tax=Cutaneotrichosporon oleaginosum TaxID=879819 RepID=A0A0J0XCT6_9TREE|nr:uncharacterized protein CC85DRAFT_289121 [Cutaneotrichosporon oleaginosum]KLT38877.1 hypothetical protein CC85DRAFT_289121 [Cutaneotrichosporon oleaginosum]TXT14282.1 hypothetical protein COLE_00475 [Cutaneotrichosporon oleaginosum]